MPTHIPKPTVIEAAGNLPKRIEEFAGRVNSGHAAVSVARMVSPAGWQEPGQRPDFEEITVVLRGALRVEHDGGALMVRAGEAVVTHQGEWVRYSTPEPEGAEYIAVCLPAFSPATVHRDADTNVSDCMDSELRRRMLDYYNERAPEYEQVYTLGTGSASIPDPTVFINEARLLAGVVQRFAQGRLIDLACGTGYWLPYYAPTCSRLTLFDQSEKMLDECRKKVDALGISERCSFLRADFFEHDFDRGSYDRVLVGFLLSHLTESQERALFDALRKMLDRSGRFLILDSAWSEERARFNSKVEHQERRLNDGTSFQIYKRYCDRADIDGWATTYGATLCVEHFETAFYAVSGSFT